MTVAGGRSRAARPERLEEEYYPRERYQRYPREYPRDNYHEGYAQEYAAHGDAYGHDYTREAYARDGYGREERAPRRERERERDDEYGASRRALNAV